MSITFSYLATPLDELLATDCPYLLRIQTALTPHGYWQLTNTPPSAWAAWLHEQETTIDELVQGADWLFATEQDRATQVSAWQSAVRALIQEVGFDVFASSSTGDEPNPGPEYI